MRLRQCNFPNQDFKFLIRFHQGAGAAETGLNVFMSQFWEILEDLELGPAIGQKVDDEFHCQARAFDHRFSHKDFRVLRYAILPIDHKSYYADQ
jgi:hypothetical protein